MLFKSVEVNADSGRELQTAEPARRFVARIEFNRVAR